MSPVPVGFPALPWVSSTSAGFSSVFHLEVLPPPVWAAGQEFPPTEKSQEQIPSSFSQRIPTEPKNCKKIPFFPFFPPFFPAPSSCPTDHSPIHFTGFSPFSSKSQTQRVGNFPTIPILPSRRRHRPPQIRRNASGIAQHSLKSLQQSTVPPQHLD